jgi:hypothetical protein
VGLARALLVGRRPADDRLDADERRPLLLAHGLVDRHLERGQVVGVVDGLHMPAVGLEALGDVLGVEAQVGRTVERDVVVVVDIDDPPEAELAGQRGRLGGDPLHEVAVGDDGEDAVVLDLGPEVRAQEALGHRHPDSVGEALAEGARRDLHAGSDVDAVALGVAGRQRAPLAEVLQLLERQVVAAEVQHRVQEHRAVAGGQDEAVAVGPRRVGGVVLHDAREEQVGDGSHRHRQPRVPGVGCLDAVHGQRADGVDAQAVDVGGGHGA